MDLGTVFWGVFAGWGLSEFLLALFRRSRRTAGPAKDRGSMLLLFASIFLAIFLGMLAARRALLPIPLSSAPRLMIALGMIVAGLFLRWMSILLLGSMFTMNVAVLQDHKLVERGPYRWLRHPSYTGLVLTLLGVGIGLGDSLGLLLLMVIPAAALYYRVRVEEAALLAAFGEAYERYRLRTWALFPGL